MYLFRCHFSSCSESTEIWHADSFCVKKCPVHFSTSGETGFKHALESPPPPPPPPSPPSTPSPPSNGIKHTHAVFLFSRIEILQCLETDSGRGGGGGVDLNTIWSIFSAFLKKKLTFFNTKRIGMPNFSGFQAT